jgi:hypothetical protein
MSSRAICVPLNSLDNLFQKIPIIIPEKGPIQPKVAFNQDVAFEPRFEILKF